MTQTFSTHGTTTSPTLQRRPWLRTKETSRAEQCFGDILALADVRIDGDRPWDMRMNDRRVAERVLGGGSVALGESYMEGGWDCEQLDQFFSRVISAQIEEKVGISLCALWLAVKSRASNMQSWRHAFEVGQRHYDLGNEFFQHMLDGRMTYSCGYWEGAGNVAEAQEAKLELICRKIDLQPGQRVLDIGCGWGSFAGYAAQRYGAEVVGITVSVEQARFANERYSHLPVEVRVQDYREVSERFDHIVSVGMFEHVGYKNYRTYMEVASRCLRDEGAFLLHTIGRNSSAKTLDPWTEKYIFPNAMLPSATQVTAAAEGLFAVRDWHSFGRYYDPTLMAWHENFEGNWDKVKAGLDERFHRMWRYYLLSCAGSFRVDKSQVWQILLSKPQKGQLPTNVR